MVTKIVSTILIVAMTVIGSMANVAAMPSEFLTAASHGKLIALQAWSPSLDSEVSLNCAIVQSNSDPRQESLVVDAKQRVPKGYWSERIIIANMDWVRDAKGGGAVLPITADIYNWDSNRYQARENLKWTDRLK